MPRHSDEGSPQRRHVQRHDTCRLRGVDDQRDALLPAQCGDLLHRLYEAEDVGDVVADHGVRVRRNQAVKGRCHRRRLEQRPGGYVDPGPQSGQRTGDGVVFIAGDHRLSSRRHQGLDGDIQRVGGIEGKDHLFRAPHVVQFRQLAPAGKGGVGGPHGRRVSAPARRAHGGKRIRHGGGHCGVLLESGGRTVEVDHGSTSR